MPRSKAKFGDIKADFGKIFKPLISRKARYKVFWGGRGAGKTWQIARALIGEAHSAKHRIGCFRELQTSIKDSVHQTLKGQIEMMGLSPYFEITEKAIRGKVFGSEFLFKGLRSNITEIKSTEGITIAWVEEAQLVSKDSWDILIPTIRVQGSEIWVSFNPIEETDPTYERFVLNPQPDSLVVKVGWQDNYWFSDTLNRERLAMLARDPEAYEHVWEGSCRVMSEAIIFRGHYIPDSFEMPGYPNDVRLFHGLDFGFANDPNAFVRCWTTGEAPNEELWIDRAVFGYQTEIDELPTMLDKIETARIWPIKADCARPETISYLRRQGFNIEPAEKWTGCVEDRIAHLKGFKQIHIGQENKELLTEARLYSYKRDRVTGEVLPVVIDKHNHGWDAVGYALDQYIPHRGGLGVWLKL
jgi:phage terminase large subunit